MEAIEESKEGPDLSEAEKLAEKARKAEAEESNESGEGHENNLIDVIGALDLAKQKARQILSAIETLFQLKDPTLKYDESLYGKAEDKLAPVLVKYELTQAGPLKYSEEITAALFLGDVMAKSVKVIRAKSEKKGDAPGGTKTKNKESAVHAKPSGPFTTQ